MLDPKNAHSGIFNRKQLDPHPYIEHTFVPKLRTVGALSSATLKQIRDEPMLFGADISFAKNVGGDITRDFISKLWEDEIFQNYLINLERKKHRVVIDSRVTMTTPTQLPSSGGWHCDDFNRNERYAQPNPEDATDRVTHFMAILGEGDGVSRTEFVNEPLTVRLDPKHVWHSLDDDLTTRDRFDTRFINNREILHFNQNAIHRATPTTNPGWRLFVRCSFTHRPVYNEVRKQVQIYIDKKGW